MKKLTLILITIISGFYVNAQCQNEIAPAIIENYTQVANTLALPLSEGLLADTNIVNEILIGFNAIYNAQQIPEVDSVFNIYCINSTYSIFSPIYNVDYNNDFLISLDTNFTWTQNWLNEEMISGNNTLDSIMQNLNYNINANFANENLVRLTLSEIVNFSYLATILNDVDGILNVQFPVTLFGDGIRISYFKENNISYFDFSLAWMNCFAGCVWTRIYSFSIDELCNVSYLGASGVSVQPVPFPDQYAPETNCNLFIDIENNFQNNVLTQVLNNPFNQQLAFKIENQNTNKMHFELIDLNGKLMIFDKANNNNTINTTALKSGYYILNIYDNNQKIATRKVLKTN